MAVPYGYDETLGISLAYIEKALYCGSDHFTRWDVGDSLVYGPAVDSSRVRFVENNNTKAVGGVGRMTRPDGCFATFQGSHDKVNGMMDALFWQTSFGRDSCQGCMVDFGFSKSYESIKADMFKALEELSCRQHPLYLVGHSLGAAMLHYLLFDVLDQGYRVSYVYALESPRPGNHIFAKVLWAKMHGVQAWRTTHHKDLVVHCPDAFTYRHVLPEIYYATHSGSDFQTCAHRVIDGVPQEDPGCANQWRPWELSLDDHLWYAAMNPTYCQNDTALSQRSLPDFLRIIRAAPGCLDVFNVLFNSKTALRGAATCGQRVTWLRTSRGGGFSTIAAMAEIARLFPGPCGPCATYSETVGLSLAYAVKALHCGEERFNRWDVGDSMIYGPQIDTSYVRFIDNNETDASAGVARMTNPIGCLVALQGSSAVANVLLHAMTWQSDFEPKECLGCAVVDGFAKGYWTIKSDILFALIEFGCENQPLYLVGHGAGAARVQYLLFDLLIIGYEVRYLYALESPRPGNTAFAKVLWRKAEGVNAWRTSHYKDVVVHCPGAVVSQHVLPEIYYPTPNGSEYRKCTWQVVEGIPQEDRLCSMQWTPWEVDFHDPGWFAGVNPATCSNTTQMSKDSFRNFRQSVTSFTPQCLSTLNVRFDSLSVMPGVASCGERINWLQTYDGGSYTLEAAITEVARLFPGPCGPCEVQGVTLFAHSALTLNLMSAIIASAGFSICLCLICVVACCCRVFRKRRQRRNTIGRTDSSVFFDDSDDSP